MIGTPTADPIFDRYWEGLLALDPLLATAVGDDRYDDRLPDLSPEGGARARALHEAVLQELAGLDLDRLGSVARVTADIAAATARDRLAALDLGLDGLTLCSHLDGPVALMAQIASLQRGAGAEAFPRLRARLTAVPRYLRAAATRLGIDAARGIGRPHAVLVRTIAAGERLVSLPAADWPAVSALPAGRREVLADLVETELKPGYRAYLDAVAGIRAHSPDAFGLVALPDGEAAYAATIRRWTTLELTPSEMHEEGRAALDAIKGQREEVLRRLGCPSLAEANDAYDRSVRRRVDSRTSLLAFVRGYVEAGWDAAGSHFQRLPKANCEVRLVEPYREANYSGAAYEPGTSDRPGTYFVNAAAYLDPAARALHRLATTSYHEANPGHHLQMALEQERSDLPSLRRFVGTLRADAMTEGWGLYAEGLADEIGLYVDDHERLGMLDNQALRAARLVVDTGVHAFGWDRGRAIAELERAGIPHLEAALEVDRYAADPAQALSYTVGELEIRRLRSELLGSRVMATSAAFHSAMLDLGAAPLPTVGRELRAMSRPPKVPRPS